MLASLLMGSGASAQTAGDAARNPGGNLVRNPQFQVAYSEWRRLPQSEVNCVDQWYRGQGSNLWSQIQRGIGPSSSTVAKVRAECRGQARAPGNPVTTSTGSQSLASASDAADRAAAEKAAAEKAAADKAAANKAAADKAAADKAAAEKATADKAIADKAAAEKAAADKAAADKAAAEKMAADKAAADKAAENKAAADKAAEKIAADKAAAQRAAADKAAAERAELDFVKEAERVKAEVTKVQADAERPQKSAENKTVDAMLAFSATESRNSFIYGLISGPIIFSLGGFMFLLLQRRRNASETRL